MSTEWVIAKDNEGPGRRLAPEMVEIRLLLPPRITKADKHWEITFDATKKKKDRLAEFFEPAKVPPGMPANFYLRPRSELVWPLYNEREWHARTRTGDGAFVPPPSWMEFRSRNHWAGKLDRMNVDLENTGLPDLYNLDPQDTLGIAFLEPMVTESDGEWILKLKTPPDPKQREEAERNFYAWQKRNPAPKLPTPPKNIRYPAKIQKRYDAWQKAMAEWRARVYGPENQNGGASPPRPPQAEDYLQLTPEEQKQYNLWKRKESIWRKTGEGNYPQPIDHIKVSP